MQAKKTILITGCSSGIGYELALFFAQKDWSVIATVRNRDQRVASQSEQKIMELLKHNAITLLDCDMDSEESMDALIKTIEQENGRLDALINNAGYGRARLFSNQNIQEARQQFQTNFFGPAYLIHKLMPLFQQNFSEKKRSVIINISSIVGEIALPFYSYYVASKHAITGLTNALAMDLAPFNIVVKAVAPGGTKTNFFHSVEPTENLHPVEEQLYRNFEHSNYNRNKTLNTPPSVVAKKIYAITLKSFSQKPLQGKWLLHTGKDANLVHWLKSWIPQSLLIKGAVRSFAMNKTQK